MKVRKLVGLGAVGLMLVAVGCGSDDEDPSGPTGGTGGTGGKGGTGGTGGTGGSTGGTGGTGGGVTGGTGGGVTGGTGGGVTGGTGGVAGEGGTGGSAGTAGSAGIAGAAGEAGAGGASGSAGASGTAGSAGAAGAAGTAGAAGSAGSAGSAGAAGTGGAAGSAGTGGAAGGGGAAGAGGAVDPCSTATCDPNATCTVENGQAVCTCDWPYHGAGTACTAPSDQNWDFEDWSYSDPPVDFLKSADAAFSLTQETTQVNDGASSCNATWTTDNNRDLFSAMYGVASPSSDYTVHLWVRDNDPAGRTAPFLWFYDATFTRITPGTGNYGSSSVDSGTWRNLTHKVTANASTAYVRGGARFYDAVSPFTSATVYLDDFDITSHEPFDVTDAALDTLTGVPASPWQLAASPMPIHVSANDEGTLYIATSRVTQGQGDRMVFVWIGTPHATQVVPMPWSKAGTVAGPMAGGLLLALIQEESNGYCEVRYILPGQTNWTAVTASSCSSQVAGALVEGTVDLPAALGGVPVTALPAHVHAAAVEVGGANGGTIVQALQTPACATCDANIQATETVAVHRARLLVGRVAP